MQTGPSPKATDSVGLLLYRPFSGAFLRVFLCSFFARDNSSVDGSRPPVVKGPACRRVITDLYFDTSQFDPGSPPAVYIE